MKACVHCCLVHLLYNKIQLVQSTPNSYYAFCVVSCSIRDAKPRWRPDMFTSPSVATPTSVSRHCEQTMSINVASAAPWAHPCVSQIEEAREGDFFSSYFRRLQLAHEYPSKGDCAKLTSRKSSGSAKQIAKQLQTWSTNDATVVRSQGIRASCVNSHESFVSD